MSLNNTDKQIFNERLLEHGLRPTKYREHVFHTLLSERDHPTADELYSRAKKGMPSISLATVYNCLETLVQSELVKQVNLERDSSRYCPNLSVHAHFHCTETKRVYDIDIPCKLIDELKRILPEDYQYEGLEISFKGVKHLNNFKTTKKHHE